MTVPISAVVDDEPKGVDLNAAAVNVTDEANAHTPDPPAVPVVDVIPDPPAEAVDGDTGLDQLRALVTDLSTTVTGLVETVTGLATAVAATVVPDEAPRKGPWTHRGSRHE